MNEKKYTEDGFLIVAESDRCALWEKDDYPCRYGCAKDCFFCRFSDFRKPDYQGQMEMKPQNDKLHSVCHHEKNKLI